jgi:ribose 5-phosphate isomerase B
MKIVIASDHAGFKLKQHIRAELEALVHEVEDVGCPDSASCDYPDYGKLAARKVAQGDVERGVLVCGTGMGMAICANRHRGVRAALCFDLFGAHMARAHNNANVLVLAGGMTGERLASAILLEFLNTAFEVGRHQRRVEKLDCD